ncbi:MAG: IS3 family transposase, partial [Chthoniobacteraceae bacterium]
MQELLHAHPGLPVGELSAALDCSRSGYHAHRRKARRKRRAQDAALALRIRQSFLAARGVYGCVRLMHALRQQGLRHGKNRLSRLLRTHGLRVRQKRRLVPRTTIADKASPVAPNHLLGRPAAQRLNEVWLTDITYIPTAEGWLYLAAEMDAASRRILGWSTLASLDTALPAAALDRALHTRSTASLPELLHHSDRGCQYTSADFRRRLELCSITQSMSRKANCYDNASIESFWATLKAECFGSFIPPSRATAHAMIFDYIETFYNPVRLH